MHSALFAGHRRAINLLISQSNCESVRSTPSTTLEEVLCLYRKLFAGAVANVA